MIINAGCANACTGVGGIADAKAMVELTSRRQFETKPQRVAGLLHRPDRESAADAQKVRRGNPERRRRNSGPANGVDAAKAIMTTDTRRKEFAMRFKVDGRKVTIGGMAKGAGMIHPNMATMLCFITTDASHRQGDR